ncbi:histidine kinase [Mangrovicella endophytica]|uniref:histidine kinase n=1 Tax=Mangrovicella endophytica TaxID=2066697 RepID=UPI000C9EA50B|nr:histidine kinase [Mangrovicella endophytica]
MPTLMRLLTTIAVIAALIYAAMAALVFLVQPKQREITVDVPLRTLQEDTSTTGGVVR